MKSISKQAQKVMDTLTEQIDKIGASNKIDNTKGTFMPVYVEFISKCKLGQIYSVTHYYEQNGDLMRDPDMEFIKGGDGKYYPISFWQDSPLVRDEPLTWGRDGEMISYNEKRQAALVTFANTWMKNIKGQQGL